MIKFNPILASIEKPTAEAMVRAQYQYHLDNLKEILSKPNVEEKDLGNDIKQVAQKRKTTVFIRTNDKKMTEEKEMTTVTFYTYKKEDGKDPVLKSAANFYFIDDVLIDDNNKNKYLPARYLDIHGNAITLEHPTNKINFIFPNNIKYSKVNQDEIDKAKEIKSEKESSSPGGGTRGLDQTDSGAPVISAAKANEYMKFIKTLIQADPAREYEAGSQITVKIPQDKRSPIPDEGFTILFRFDRSKEEAKEVRIDKDTEEFYIDVPSDITGKKSALMGKIDGIERTIKNITIKAAAPAAPAPGAPRAEGSNQTEKPGSIDTNPPDFGFAGAFEVVNDGKPLDPGGEVKIKFRIVNNGGNDDKDPKNTKIPIEFKFEQSDAKGIPSCKKDIPWVEKGFVDKDGKEGKEIILTIPVPSGLTDGTAYLTADINPAVRSRTYKNQYGAEQEESVYSINEDGTHEKSNLNTISVDIKKGVLDKKDVTMWDMAWNAENKDLEPKDKKMSVADLGGQFVPMNGGYMTADKAGGLGIYVRQNCFSPRNPEDLKNTCLSEIKNGATGFCYDNTQEVCKYVPASEQKKSVRKTANPPTETIDEQYECECTNSAGEKYTVIMHTSITIGSRLGVINDSIKIITLKHPNPKDLKDKDDEDKPFTDEKGQLLQGKDPVKYKRAYEAKMNSGYEKLKSALKMTTVVKEEEAKKDDAKK